MARRSSHASDARVLEKRPHAGRRSPVIDRLISLPGSSHPISSAVAAASPFRTDIGTVRWLSNLMDEAACNHLDKDSSIRYTSLDHLPATN